jgi:hypothetical protein
LLVEKVENSGRDRELATMTTNYITHQQQHIGIWQKNLSSPNVRSVDALTSGSEHHESSRKNLSIATSVDSIGNQSPKSRNQPELNYCPDCGWNTYPVFFPGNNGLIIYECCSFCGWFGKGD